MKGIYYKHGVYVVIDNDTENDSCILHPKYRRKASIYGGRVKLSTDPGFYLQIDNIKVIKMTTFKWSENETKYYIDDRLSSEEVVSHLNAIEVHGVEAFLQNYKQSIIFLYNELKELNNKTESLLTTEHDEAKIKSLISELANIRNLFFMVLPILFSIYKYMTAGLENERVISVCQSIMDSLS